LKKSKLGNISMSRSKMSRWRVQRGVFQEKMNIFWFLENFALIIIIGKKIASVQRQLRPKIINEVVTYSCDGQGNRLVV